MNHAIGTALAIFGVILFILSCISVIRPVKTLWIRSRKQAFLIMIVSLVVEGIGGSMVEPTAAGSITSVGVANTEHSPTNPEPSSTKSSLSSLDPRALKLAQISFEEDLRLSLLTHEKTVITPNQALSILNLSTRVKSDEFDRDYENNEIAADEKYRDKQFLISGTITSISKDFLDSPYVTFRGVNEFAEVQARLTSDAAEQPKQFKKGDTVNLICRGGDMALTIAVAKDCDLYDDYLKYQRSKLDDNITSFLTGEYALPKFMGAPILMIYVMGTELPNSSLCFISYNIDICNNEIEKIENPAMKQDVIAKVAALKPNLKYAD